MSNIDLGKRVQHVRNSAGLNQRDFAKRLGTSSGRVSEVESGKTMPRGDFLQRIHQEFGIDITWLLTGDIGGSVPLSHEEQALLDNFRNSPEAGKEAIQRTAFALAQSQEKIKGKAA